MRRNVITCIENSTLAPRIAKPQTLVINYISLAGYELTQIKARPVDLIIKEQVKAALIVIAHVCSPEFSMILKTIAN
jgi:hypothetical protein